MIHSGKVERLKERAGINATSKPVIHSGKVERLKERAGINASSKPVIVYETSGGIQIGWNSNRLEFELAKTKTFTATLRLLLEVGRHQYRLSSTEVE